MRKLDHVHGASLQCSSQNLKRGQMRDSNRLRSAFRPNMEGILNEIGLGILKERFAAERIEPKIVACLSDGNLASLGVSTIGDRTRLRELCATSVKKESKEPSEDDSKTSYRERVREERNRFYQPYNSSASGRGKKRKLDSQKPKKQ